VSNFQTFGCNAGRPTHCFFWSMTGCSGFIGMVLGDCDGTFETCRPHWAMSDITVSSAASEIHPLRPLNCGLSVDKFDLHSIDLSYGPWRKSRKGSDQPRAWRQPCNCRERFFHFGAGECLTDAAMRTRTENQSLNEAMLD
jgi:hypothetical protein